MSAIQAVSAREILDSRGNPTVECDLVTDKGLFRAAVPSGASTGIHEACELRDGDKSRYLGKGVKKACEHIEHVLGPAVHGMDPVDQAAIDEKLKAADGTGRMEKLGANAILAVSLAACKAGAAHKMQPLYKHIAEISGSGEPTLLPVPCFNVINGGKHGGNRLAFQEFMIIPTGASSFKQAMQWGCEVYHTLKGVLKAKYGQDSTNVGDEGGFAPPVVDPRETLETLQLAIKKAGHEGSFKIAMDCAASEFYDSETKLYDLDFKKPDGESDQKISGTELAERLRAMSADFPIVSIEDPYDQDDWDSYKTLTSTVGTDVQVVGDDLLVTNPTRIREAVDRNACNALLLKVNQIGTITDAIEAAKISKSAGWGVMVSHRSGETEDTTIADLVVGLGTGQIKTGAPCRGERVAKYNQLLRIEEELGASARYAGKNFRKSLQS